MSGEEDLDFLEVMDVGEEVLSVKEDQGGLNAASLVDRNRSYQRFEQYIQGEIGLGVKEALETENSRIQFERELGR